MTTTYKINDLATVAKQVLEEMTSKTLLFYGDMGSGKTTLIKAMVKALGGDDDTSSPTFSIVNEYEVENDVVYHFDLFRIENETEAYDIGIEDYLYSGHYNFIEWPEKIKALLPHDADRLYVSINQDGSRSLKLDHAMNLTQ
ncbi:MAG: tRNA (adenosine(37)-N6)-threonylcarbamoyltransferase complex ATPase subunit type 1 TsaE [Flavobacteriaceae bacterium]|nr:tRNA (adenosine(37)-N6)-threonylcarbamoyltransferase complex ATPase subunit type 1 TsaE [Bacteroidia bacterium]NND09593.1 tRNA (adenosine(37)-N6)-threonylcarbamoyltransferase complex ATPase subunit type 1 TsaE [Flavobacteriaceae bacterium]NNK27349.1 tRNA (adenosine(37)-N6)-threonylcarbamoyltransferase complex ATPase subunit type 1 TsaE [Flavobacteriaceae bacterium]NNL59699.1 tRNA (adenosine(37)-N6)-threonylcarbamoyltransferase complex ATPase subunit type 1 TsaE [Flavobacteriaceae bacterium]